ncbi:MAG: carboxypeptidase-like regulatory domain-containing protein, partial [bacterium]
PHPVYSVSQSNGTFTISNLPPGQYTVVAWHEKYGQQEQQVTVGAKESRALSFTFKG